MAYRRRRYYTAGFARPYFKRRINWRRINKNKVRAMANTKRKWLKRGLLFGAVAMFAIRKAYPNFRAKLPAQAQSYLDKILI